MNKYLSTILLALTLCGTANAKEFPIDLEGKPLEMLPVLCPTFRLTLPKAQRDPWDAKICLRAFAIDAMKQHHLGEVHRASRERERAIILDARKDFEAPTVGIGTP